MVNCPYDGVHIHIHRQCKKGLFCTALGKLVTITMKNIYEESKDMGDWKSENYFWDFLFDSALLICGLV